MRAGPRGGALLPGAAGGGGGGGGARAAGGLLRRAWLVALCAFLGAFLVARQLAAARLSGPVGEQPVHTLLWFYNGFITNLCIDIKTRIITSCIKNICCERYTIDFFIWKGTMYKYAHSYRKMIDISIFSLFKCTKQPNTAPYFTYRI